jgi:chromatin structure-remodeling complex protein RSC7
MWHIAVTDRKDTQPTRCRWEVMPDSSKRKVLGGTKAGNGAWAVAWVDTVMEVPSADEVDEEARKGRDILMDSIADE